MERRCFFLVVQKAMIREDGKYLILRRSPDSHAYPDHWDFPGGKHEKGEDTLTGLKREAFEEIGVEIDAVRPVFTFHEFVNDLPVVFIVYACKLI